MVRRLCNPAGLTLVELMVAVVILAIGILAFFSSFSLISRSVHNSKVKLLANALCQEKMEQLKDISYFSLLVTTSTTTDARFNPSLYYDNGVYLAQTITEGSIQFTRSVRVDFAFRSGSTISTTTWTTEDTGIKLITVYTIWKDGNVWRVETLQNIQGNQVFNPLDASFTGTVSKAGGGTLPGAQIQVIENAAWFAYSQAGGQYSFKVSPGTYTLQCSLAGYYSQTTPSYLPITDNQTIVQNFTLSPISTGSATGYIYYFNNLVVSQVVASTDISNGVEYVELYNPTSNPVNIQNNMNLLYWDNNNSSTTVALTYISTYVPVNHYYLIANNPTVHAGGITLNADATYSNSLYQSPNHLMSTTTAGGVELVTQGIATHIDGVGWNGSVLTPPSAYPASPTEGVGLSPASGVGLAAGEQWVRMTDPGTVRTGYGNSYDSGNNNLNFIDSLTLAYAPHNKASSAQIPNAGIPATNALVNFTDPLSSTVRATAGTVSGGYPIATFTVPGIETGTWAMAAYLGGNYIQESNVTITANISTGVANGSTSPAWVIPGSTNTLLASNTNYAIIGGTVFDPFGAPLSNIRVSFNGRSTYTGADGSYFLSVPPGTAGVFANLNYNNPAYTLGVVYLTVAAGNVYDPENITIYLGGTIQGFYQTPSGDPLPGRTAVGLFNGGNQYTEAVSDQTGYFYLRNITTGTYTIFPALNPAEVASPPSQIIVLTSTGSANFISTFTITNALGQISGQTLLGTTPITTGILVYATTTTLSTALPPPVSGVSSPLCNPCSYSDLSDGAGNYTLSVRSSPNPYQVYGWYSTTSVGVVTTTRTGPYAVTVSTGQTANQNLTW